VIIKTFRFGKYKGDRLDVVAAQDPKYFTWALENVEGFKAYAENIKPGKIQRHVKIKSSCGNGHIKNAGFPKPGKKKFVSKASKQYQGPQPNQYDYLSDILDAPQETDHNPETPPW
jgi:hypothetical protein